MNKRYLTPAQIYYSLANLRQITFEVTDACNLKCKYCGYGEFYDDYDRRSNKMMPFTMETDIHTVCQGKEACRDGVLTTVRPIHGHPQLCKTNRRPVCPHHRQNQCTDRRSIHQLLK